MLSRSRIALVFSLLGFVAGAFVWFRPPIDPLVQGRPASAWVLDLLSSDYRTRGEAQSALQQLGSNAVPHVRVLLRKSTPGWQGFANRLAPVFPFLKDDGLDPGLCRQRGAEFIALLGPAGAEAVPELISSLSYPAAVSEAERALRRAGSAAVLPLVRALRARQPEVRARSARLLKEFNESQDLIASALIRALRDEHFSVRREAALTLGVVSAGKSAAVAALIQTASDEVAEVRAASFESLGKLADISAPVLSAVNRGLKDLIPLVRLEAAKACWVLTRDRDAVVPVLMGVLPTQEGWQAAYALGNMGADAATAVPALIEVLRREQVPRAFRTPPSSSIALGQIREPAISALEQVLSDPEPAVRIAAVLALGFMGEHARPAVPRLQKLLRDPDREIRHVTAITLAGAGADRELILPGLEDCLTAEDIYVRSTAAALLRRIAPEQEWTVLPE
jgi:HEAT repeat protein